MSPFEAATYKEFLRVQVEQARGRLTLLAKEAGCQPSYLLRVLHEEAHLTPDQGFRLARFWALAEPARDYFLMSLHHERSSDAGHREFLRRQMERLLADHNDLKKVVARDAPSSAQLLLEYHADWQVALVHFLTACPAYREKGRLAARARLSDEDLSAILDALSKQNLVKHDRHSVIFQQGAAHIPQGSPILPIFHSNWRQRAVQSSARMHNGHVHFTNIQTIGRSDLQALHDQAKLFIQKAKALCDSSGSEEVVAVNLDVFVP